MQEYVNLADNQDKVEIPYGNKETTNSFVLAFWMIVQSISITNSEIIQLEASDSRLKLLVEPFVSGYCDAQRDCCSKARYGYSITKEITDTDLLVAMNLMYVAGLDAGNESIYS
jgi:hypothetical protein